MEGAETLGGKKLSMRKELSVESVHRMTRRRHMYKAARKAPEVGGKTATEASATSRSRIGLRRNRQHCH
jgi:hypothetical protein